MEKREGLIIVLTVQGGEKVARKLMDADKMERHGTDNLLVTKLGILSVLIITF